MQNFQIPYGAGKIAFTLPDQVPADWIVPPEPDIHPDPGKCVSEAIESPVGNFRWGDFRGIHSAAIAINDKTRPVPHEYLLPPLLKKLESIGLAPKDIHLIVATGTHVPMRSEEFARILPPQIAGRYPVISHDCDSSPDLIALGATQRGTPVFINRQYQSADLRIVVGDIEPHHFMGYSGGVKSAAIGLAGRETINRNHSMLTDPHSFTGHYEDNPMRMDVEEIGQMMGIQLAVNAVLSREKEIVQVICGSPVDVMREGIPLVKRLCQVAVKGDYPMVIASAGGQPKDINFYQSQKALTHAAMLAADGGTVLLAAACPEGLGSRAYEQWIEGMTSHEQVIVRFTHEGFRVGPHKAFQVARLARRVNIVLYSQMPDALVRKILLKSTPDFQAEIDRYLTESLRQAPIAILPYAVSTIPFRSD